MHDFPQIIFTKEAGVVTTTIRDALAVLPDGTYQMTIEKTKKIRSPEHNRLYRVVLNIGSQWSKDYSPEELHAIFKDAFIEQKYMRSKIDGRRRIKIPKTTTKLSPQEFDQFIMKAKETCTRMW